MNFGWKWDELSANGAFTISEILSHSNLPWTFYVNFNPNLTVEEYFKYRDTALFDNNYGDNDSYIRSFCTMIIKEEDFINYPQLVHHPHSKYLNLNSSVTIEMLHKVGVPINYYLLSQNDNLTMAHVLANINEKWNWRALSYHLTN